MKKSSMLKINILPLSMYVLLLLFIFLMRGVSTTIETFYKIGLSFLWIVFATYEKKDKMKKTLSTKLSIFVMLFILLKLVINLFISDNFSEPINSAISSLSFYVGIFVVQYYYFRYCCENNKNNISKVRDLVIGLTMIYIFYCIKAIIFYRENPGAGRIFKEFQNRIAIGNGYGLAFGAAVLASYSIGIYMLINSYRKIKRIKIILIILILLSSLICFYIQSSIVIYSMLIGTTFNLFFARKIISLKKNFFLLIIFLFLSFIIIVNKENILEFILSIVNQLERNAVIDRIKVVLNYFLYGTQSIAISGRKFVYLQSIQSFFKHPIIGAAIETTYYGLKLIGDHSTILDEFARYGFLLGFFNLYIFIKPYMRLYFSNSGRAFGAAITLILISIFNPITQSTATAIIFLYIGMIEILIISINAKFFNEIK
ncbi:hypothetical protein [Fusobacterium sp.]|uniref:hypothetical protein n=1 Tax=Fusobacterium sp. TaxID=68766 RepID=UPI00260AEDCE|nr:hypothetical protein [Fusobacterium sp.]